MANILENPISGVDSIGGLFIKLLDSILIIAIPIITLALIYTGFKMVISNRNTRESAKQSFLYVLLGAFLILASKGIIELLENTVKQVTTIEEEEETS